MKRATAAERERMERVKQMPCVACDSKGYAPCGPTEVHHLLSGNKRRGGEYTIPLCRWHHRGVTDGVFGVDAHEAALGPSLARSSKRFREVFGDDEALLALTNDRLREGG